MPSYTRYMEKNSMRMELTLSELYVLGNLMGAQYLDADYFPSDGAFSDYKLTETKAKVSLAEKNIIHETFLTVKVNESFARLLEPLFFGVQVASIFIGDCTNRVEQFTKYHFYQGRVTMAELAGDTLTLEDITTEAISKNLSLIMGDYEATQNSFDEDNMEAVSRAIIVKQTIMHKRKDSIYIYVQDGNLFMAVNDGKLLNSSSSNAVNTAESILVEANYGL